MSKERLKWIMITNKRAGLSYEKFKNSVLLVTKVSEQEFKSMWDSI